MVKLSTEEYHNLCVEINKYCPEESREFTSSRRRENNVFIANAFFERCVKKIEKQKERAKILEEVALDYTEAASSRIEGEFRHDSN